MISIAGEIAAAILELIVELGSWIWEGRGKTERDKE
jgi:hypothetical protein